MIAKLMEKLFDLLIKHLPALAKWAWPHLVKFAKDHQEKWSKWSVYSTEPESRPLILRVEQRFWQSMVLVSEVFAFLMLILLFQLRPTTLHAITGFGLIALAMVFMMEANATANQRRDELIRLNA